MSDQNAPAIDVGSGKVDENFRNMKHLSELRLGPQAEEV